MIDSFGQTQSINIDESVDENDTGLKLRGQKPQIVISKPRINKLEQSLNSEILQTLERDQEDISGIMFNQSPAENYQGMFRAAVNRALGEAIEPSVVGL
jgi:hypothetical protein